MKRRKRGGQPGNKNAAGHGAPLGNKNAWRHGVYERYPPLYPKEREYLDQAEARENIKRARLNARLLEMGYLPEELPYLSVEIKPYKGGAEK